VVYSESKNDFKSHNFGNQMGVSLVDSFFRDQSVENLFVPIDHKSRSAAMGLEPVTVGIKKRPPAQKRWSRRVREKVAAYGPFASFFWPGLMRLAGATPELLAFPARCAPSVLLGFGAPAFVPGIDSPRVVPFVEAPVVVGAAVAEPLPDEPLSANASVLEKANAAAKAKVDLIAVPSCCWLITKSRKEFPEASYRRALKQKSPLKRMKSSGYLNGDLEADLREGPRSSFDQVWRARPVSGRARRAQSLASVR
jgi:hypothetical protein